MGVSSEPRAIGALPIPTSSTSPTGLFGGRGKPVSVSRFSGLSRGYPLAQTLQSGRRSRRAHPGG